MAKKASPLDIMNSLAGAAHKKAQPSPSDHDEDDMPAKSAKKSPKQAAAVQEKKKGYAPSPKVPKPS
jgi:hypothetical protein